MRRASWWLLLALLPVLAGSSSASGPLPLATSDLYPSPNERFGFGAIAPLARYDVASLAAGWYLNWGVPLHAVHPQGIRTAYVVRLKPGSFSPAKAVIAAVLAEDPGAFWLIGNEPDCIFQDGVTPEQYVSLYHELYGFIKIRDPLARVAVGAIVAPTALRLRWLEAVWNLYATRYGRLLPADAWNIHNFILQEAPGDWGPDLPPGICAPWGALYGVNQHASLEVFAQHVVAMRRWMAAHGEREKPLIISEYGILFNAENGYDLTRVQDFLRATFDYLLTATDPELGLSADGNRLVQQWLWYSLDDDKFSGWGAYWGNLADPGSGALTALGQTWAAYAGPLHRSYVDIAPLALQLTGTVPVYGIGGPATIRASVANVGNTASTRPVTATLYANVDGVRQEIARQVFAGLPARYDGAAWVMAAWDVPATAPWSLHVTAEQAGGSGGEATVANNTLTITRSLNLHLTEVAVTPGRRVIVPPGEAAAITLTAGVENWGHLGLAGAQVRFADGDDRELGVVALPIIAPWGQARAVLGWPGLRGGAHIATATIMLPPDVPEDDRSDNAAQVTFFIASYQQFVPAIVGRCATQYTCVERLTDGGFETGDLAGWTLTGTAFVLDSGCYDGAHCVWLGLPGSPRSELRRRLEIPPEDEFVSLTLAWGALTGETMTAQDFLTVELWDEQDRLLRRLLAVDNREAAGRWYPAGFDVSDLVGRTVELRIAVSLVADTTTTFFLDAVRLRGCRAQ